MQPELEAAPHDLRVIADPTRREILRLLLDHSRLGVTDLATRLDLRQPTVSHHLRLLEGDGLVVRQAEGRHRYAALAPHRLGEVAGWLQSGEAPPPAVVDPAAFERIVDDLTQRFAGRFSRETVAECVRDSAELLARRPRSGTLLTSLTAQFAAERLTATAQVTPAHDSIPDVLFVCVQNAGRSQLAAAILRFLGGNTVRVRTAGSEPASAIHPLVVTALDEIGVPVGGEFPKPLTDDTVRAADVVITMGCGDACPIYPGIRYLDWELPDPATLSLDGIRAVRDDIDARVRDLLVDLRGLAKA